MWHYLVTHVLFTNNLHDVEVSVNKQSIRGLYRRCVALQNAKTLENGVNMAMNRYTPFQNVGSMETSANFDGSAYVLSILHSSFSFKTHDGSRVIASFTFFRQRNMQLTLLQCDVEYSTMSYYLTYRSDERTRNIFPTMPLFLIPFKRNRLRHRSALKSGINIMSLQKLFSG